MKTFYLQVDSNNIIRDAITYPYGDYIPYDADMLPIGINGGWFKFENGQVVEYPELKPVDKDEQIRQLEEALAVQAERNQSNEQAIIELTTVIGGMM